MRVGAINSHVMMMPFSPSVLFVVRALCVCVCFFFSLIPPFYSTNTSILEQRGGGEGCAARLSLFVPFSLFS